MTSPRKRAAKEQGFPGAKLYNLGIMLINKHVHTWSGFAEPS